VIDGVAGLSRSSSKNPGFQEKEGWNFFGLAGAGSKRLGCGDTPYSASLGARVRGAGRAISSPQKHISNPLFPGILVS
jgi:hypothetical protein